MLTVLLAMRSKFYDAVCPHLSTSVSYTPICVMREVDYYHKSVGEGEAAVRYRAWYEVGIVCALHTWCCKELTVGCWPGLSLLFLTRLRPTFGFYRETSADLRAAFDETVKRCVSQVAHRFCLRKETPSFG